MWDFRFFAYENISKGIYINGGSIDVKEKNADSDKKTRCL